MSFVVQPFFVRPVPPLHPHSRSLRLFLESDKSQQHAQNDGPRSQLLPAPRLDCRGLEQSKGVLPALAILSHEGCKRVAHVESTVSQPPDVDDVARHPFNVFVLTCSLMHRASASQGESSQQTPCTPVMHAIQPQTTLIAADEVIIHGGIPNRLGAGWIMR